MEGGIKMDIGCEFKPWITPREQYDKDYCGYLLSTSSVKPRIKVDSMVWFNGFTNASKYPSRIKALYMHPDFPYWFFSEMGSWNEDIYVKDRMWPDIHYGQDFGIRHGQEIWL